jgi:putative transposase
MPRAVIEIEESYHVFNRGLNKQIIFKDRTDYSRMLLYLLYFQADVPITNIAYAIKQFLQTKEFSFTEQTVKAIIENRTVKLEAFALMPNHFHLMVRELKEGGISRYLQRIEVGFTKYFNTKYERSGYLLQGPFQSVHVENNEQALYLSAYIHKNPCEILQWRKQENNYTWSSYQDYVQENRWGKLLSTKLILDQFETKDMYKEFVDDSKAKDLSDIGGLIKNE